MLNDLKDAIDAMPTPCEVHACPIIKRCAREHLACYAFLAYVRSGRVLNPHVIAVSNKAGVRRPVYGPIEATAETYDTVMRWTDENEEPAPKSRKRGRPIKAKAA